MTALLRQHNVLRTEKKKKNFIKYYFKKHCHPVLPLRIYICQTQTAAENKE